MAEQSHNNKVAGACPSEQASNFENSRIDEITLHFLRVPWRYTLRAIDWSASEIQLGTEVTFHSSVVPWVQYLPSPESPALTSY